MKINLYLDKYKYIRYVFFRKIYELNILNKMILALSFACLTGLLAQFRFYFPFTPVPVTGQVFAVLFAGILLGRYYGGISQLIYLSVGLIGVPWFQGMNGGIAYILGPTGGYLIGFVFASFFIGHIVDKYLKSRTFLGMIVLVSFSTFILIYIPGMIWFYVWSGFSIEFIDVFFICVFPFVFIDLFKTLAASGIAALITPKNSYGQKVES